MNIENKYPVMIFRNEYDGKIYYKMGLSKKGIDGKYINGTIPCRFNKALSVDDKTKIYLKNAWLDFYNVEVEKNGKKYKETRYQIFINECEEVEETINKSNSEIVREVVEDDPFKEFSKENEDFELDLPF